MINQSIFFFKKKSIEFKKYEGFPLVHASVQLFQILLWSRCLCTHWSFLKAANLTWLSWLSYLFSEVYLKAFYKFLLFFWLKHSNYTVQLNKDAFLLFFTKSWSMCFMKYVWLIMYNLGMSLNRTCYETISSL